MSSRVVSSTTMDNVLEYLMFCSSGKKRDSTFEFIKDNIKEGGEEVKTRFDDFYLPSTFIATQLTWSQEKLTYVLDYIEELQRTYPEAEATSKWLRILRTIVFQVGLCFLRKEIELMGDDLPGDPADFVIPNNISVAAYHNEIKALLEKHMSYYIEEGTADMHPDFVHHNELLTGVINKIASRKSKGDAIRKLNEEKVYELLQEHCLTVFTQSIVKFIQCVEEKVLPIPLDVETGESFSNTQRRSAGESIQHHQWKGTDAAAEAHVQYRQYGESSSARKPRAGSEQEVPAAAASSSRSKITSSATEHAHSSPVLTQSAPVSFAHAAAQQSRSVTSAKRKNAEADENEEDEAEEGAGTMTALMQRQKRKYEVSETNNPFQARTRRTVDTIADNIMCVDDQIIGQLSAEDQLIRKENAKQERSRYFGATTKVSSNPQAIKKMPTYPDGSLFEMPLESDEENGSSDSKFDSAEDKSAPLRTANKGSRKGISMRYEGSSKDRESRPRPSATTSIMPRSVDVSVSSEGTKSEDEPTETAMMGKRQVWSYHQEEALQRAVARYGEGKWREILLDSRYAEAFEGRTNVNLKDKWRNMKKGFA